MFFLELAGERPRSAATAAAPILGLDHVVVSTEDPERAAALYGARLGLDMALDRSHQDWGQLMFFRCGDLIVEVVRRPVAGAPTRRHDKLWGLSWRVADIDATRARLVAAGIDVIRGAHRPQAGHAGDERARAAPAASTRCCWSGRARPRLERSFGLAGKAESAARISVSQTTRCACYIRRFSTITGDQFGQGNRCKREF